MQNLKNLNISGVKWSWIWMLVASTGLWCFVRKYKGLSVNNWYWIVLNRIWHADKWTKTEQKGLQPWKTPAGSFYYTSVKKQFCYQSVSPPNMILSIVVVLCFFYSVLPLWRAQPAWFGLEAEYEPVSVWNKSPAMSLTGLLSATAVQKQKGIHLSLSFLMSVQSYSKQKQQGNILIAALSGGGFCLPVAGCSPLTWSHLNRYHPH